MCFAFFVLGPGSRYARAKALAAPARDTKIASRRSGRQRRSGTLSPRSDWDAWRLQRRARQPACRFTSLHLDAAGANDLRPLVDFPLDPIGEFLGCAGDRLEAEPERRPRTSGSATILTISRCKRSMTSCGVPPGT